MNFTTITRRKQQTSTLVTIFTVLSCVSSSASADEVVDLISAGATVLTWIWATIIYICKRQQQKMQTLNRSVFLSQEVTSEDTIFVIIRGVIITDISFLVSRVTEETT